MRKIDRGVSYWGFAFVLVLGTFEAVNAYAYVDPGTTGLLSQILYVLFYGALGVFLYCLRYVKDIVASGRRRLAKLFSRHTYNEPPSDRGQER